MTVFRRVDAIVCASGSIIEREVGDVVLALQLLQHVVRADFPALVNGMKQLSFQPQDSHKII